MRGRTLGTLAALVSTALLACAAAQTTPAPTPPPADAPKTPPANAPTDAPAGAPTDASAPPRPRLPAARYPDVDSLLTAAERVSEKLTDYVSEVSVISTDDVTGDTERRNGSVILVQEAGKPSTRKFAVVLTSYVDSSGRVDQRPVRYLYADGWLTEADFTQRTLIRRQLARAGEEYDPLRPGEGPVPLPIGQRKSEVLRRFEAELVAVPTAPQLSKLTDVQGVKLTPRPGMADRDLKSATLWYDLRLKTPVAVEVEKKNGRSVVLLRNTAMNAGLTDEQRALLTLAAGQTEGWRVDERPLENAGSGEKPAAPPAKPPTL